MPPKAEGQPHATISVIVPTLNEEYALSHALAAMTDLPGSWEIIIADSGSSDRTLEIASAFPVTVIPGLPRGRGTAMNAGAAAATGDLLLFLHADTALPDDAHKLISDALAKPEIAATGFRLRMDSPEWRFRVLTAVATVRHKLQRTFFGDQAIAVRRQDFERLGGYRALRLMEDVDLSKRLRRRGKLQLLPAHVTTSARRFERGGVLRTLALMSFFQVAYSLGVSPERLNRWYRDVRLPDENVDEDGGQSNSP